MRKGPSIIKNSLEPSSVILSNAFFFLRKYSIAPIKNSTAYASIIFSF